MAAAFGNRTLVQNVNVVRTGHIGQPVGDQNDGFVLCQRVDLLHNVVFTFYVDVGCGFVEDVNRAVVEQCPGQSQPLALAAGKVAGLFVQPGVQSLLTAQEVRQLHLFQHGPQTLVVRFGPAHPQIVPDGALEQIALMADIGEVLHQALFPDVRQGHAAHGDTAGVSLVPPHEDGGEGGFAAAAFAHDGGEAAHGEVHVHAVQDLPLSFISETQALAVDGAVGGDGGGLFRGLRQIQQAEDLAAGRHTVHGDVEEAAQHTHGQKEICRQQNDHQAACKLHMARAEPGHRQDHAQGRAAVGDEIHDGDGVELHSQHLHGDAAEMLGLFVHFPVLEFICLINFCSGQALQVFQEGIAQGGVLAPVFGQQLFGPPLDGRDGHGDQGHADQKHQCAGKIHEAQNGKQGQRRQHGVEKLGKILSKVGLQLVDALHGHLHHLRGVDLLPVSRAQPQQLAVDLLSQDFLHRFGGQVAHPAGPDGAGEPHSHGDHCCDGSGGELTAPGIAFMQLLQKARNGTHHGDVGQEGDPLERHIPGNVFSAFADRSDQPFVDHHRGNCLSEIC